MATPLTAAQFAAAYGLVREPGVTPPSPRPFLTYITGPGDRWDNIAWHAYGDPTMILPLIAANVAITISPVLAQGTVIYCPLQSPPSAAANNLPWSP